jgi:hypothetical protein
MRYEEITAGQTVCTGLRAGYRLPCRGTLFKCPSCGHAGCKQNKPDMCTSQGFDAWGRCLKCNARGAEAVPFS